MSGGTQLEARPVEAPPAESVALAPPQSHQPHEPPAPQAPASSPVSLPASPCTSPTPPPSSRSRRLFLRAAFTLGVIGGTAAALLPVLRADPRRAGPPAAEAPGLPAAELFDEMYGGRHIQGTASGVRIDGRSLHIMRRADGSHLSVVNHYESFPTALATARAAVDDLGGAQLSPAGPAIH
ncbi:tyrosinase family oxidase copper chaperone [Streptomyces sp. NBC_01511]|uniref:tyrosinase family oxidase copper chaperone n=1 Tax=Streptomyces sp. NBC_01511 TaxID=2903889 RepID=UPI00386D77A0